MQRNVMLMYVMLTSRLKVSDATRTNTSYRWHTVGRLTLFERVVIVDVHAWPRARHMHDMHIT